MSLEIVGNNSIKLLMAAAHLGLPLVDADTDAAEGLCGQSDP
jgi:DUF917 family protein